MKVALSKQKMSTLVEGKPFTENGPRFLSFLDPIQQLKKKTQDVTKIQIKKPVQTFTQDYNIQIAGPIPLKPFWIALPDIVFGQTKILVDPSRFPESGQRQRHPSQSHRLIFKARHHIQSDSIKPEIFKVGYVTEVQTPADLDQSTGPVAANSDSTNENLAVSTANSSMTETTLSHALQADDIRPEDLQQHVNYTIHTHLIYFKCVEERVREVLSKSKKSFARNQVAVLSDLQRDLRLFITNLDKFQLEYSDILHLDFVQQNVEFKEILQCTANLTEILQALEELGHSLKKLSFAERILGGTMERKEEHLLCSILGLKDEVADMLLVIDSEMRDHQTNQHWIDEYMEQKVSMVSGEAKYEEQFKGLGFNESKASLLASLLHKNPYACHKTAKEWAKNHITSCFKYNILLNPLQGEYNKYNLNKACDTNYSIPTITDEDSDTVDVPAIDHLVKDSKDKALKLKDFSKTQEKALEGELKS